MTISLFTVIILLFVGVVCVIIAHQVPDLPPVVRTLLLVAGWICIAVGAILGIIWLVGIVAGTNPQPAHVDALARWLLP